MCRAIWFVLLALSSARLASQVVVLRGPGQPKYLSVAGPIRGNVQMEFQETRVSISLSGSKSGQADLYTTYEPNSKLFWWDYQQAEADQTSGSLDDFLAHTIFYVTQQKIVCFFYYAQSFGVRESSERYSSMTEAQTALLDVLKSQRKGMESGSVRWFRDIKIAGRLPREFFHQKLSSSPFPEPKLRKVEKVGHHWQVTFEGPNGDSAIVVLNDDYEVVSASILPNKPR